MVKRKLSSSQDKHLGDSENEAAKKRPAKVSKLQSGATLFSSTPLTMPKAQPSTSKACRERFHSYKYNRTAPVEMSDEDCAHHSFSSLLRSIDGLSDGESKSVAVPSAAKRRSGISTDNAPTRQIVYLNTSPLDTNFEVSSDEIKSLPIPWRNLEIIALPHKSCLTLHGYLTFSVLAGSVTVNGYIVKENLDNDEDKKVIILSSELTGFKQVVTRQFGRTVTDNDLLNKMSKIAEGEKPEKIAHFMECVDERTVVVLIEQRLIPPKVEFAQQYLPDIWKLGTPKNVIVERSYCSLAEKKVLEVSAEAERTSFYLKGLTKGARVLVRGQKLSGKSSLLRYLINTVLNDQQCVYYLDLDPGQTEFTPPGVISLSKVTKPMLVPPFLNAVNPDAMIAIGSPSAKLCPSLYCKAAKALLEDYKEKHVDETLFVNTMGWVDGFGAELLKRIEQALEPTLLIDLAFSSECPEFTLEVNGKKRHITLPVKKHARKSYSSKDLRNFAILTNLGKYFNSYMCIESLNAMQPKSICWEDIAIHVMGKTIEYNYLIQSINCSFVNLCRVDEALINEPVVAGYPKVLAAEPINECLGFGFVRAIDVDNHILHIATPVSLIKLAHVNAIIKGEVQVPDEVILKQPIYDTPLPYTCVYQEPLSALQMPIPNRKFFSQAKPKNQ